MSKEGSNFSPEEGSFSELFYHHARPLEFCFHQVTNQPKIRLDDTDQMFDGAYSWLETQVGFYPLFMAVGGTQEDVRMTGYQNQWSQHSKDKNLVLFSYKEMTTGIFVDYMNWHIVLNSEYRNYEISQREKQMIFRPSWSKTDWLRYARGNRHSVQLVVPTLDLTEADSTFCRNEKTRQHLISLGFQNVGVKRITVQSKSTPGVYLAD